MNVASALLFSIVTQYASGTFDFKQKKCHDRNHRPARFVRYYRYRKYRGRPVKRRQPMYRGLKRGGYQFLQRGCTCPNFMYRAKVQVKQAYALICDTVAVADYRCISATFRRRKTAVREYVLHRAVRCGFVRAYCFLQQYRFPN